MIIPKYDNRYFGSVAERFEEMARERGLLPIITCTRRSPDLELETVKAMLSWQVDWVIATGATNPDKISALCQQAGVPTINLDLPGSLSPSVISDNYGGAKALTHKILANSARRRGELAPLTFIGGRSNDHNTSERLRGFHDAHHEQGCACRRRIFWLPAIRKVTLRPACRSGLAARRRYCRGYLLTRRYPRRGCALAVAGRADRQRAAADGLLRLGSVCLSAGARYRHGAAGRTGDAGRCFSIIDAGEASQQRIEIPPRLMSSS